MTYKICEDELGLKSLCADVPMYSVIEAVASDQQVKLEPLSSLFGLKVSLQERGFLQPSKAQTAALQRGKKRNVLRDLSGTRFGK